MRPLTNWKVNPQPSSGPSVRGPSPDPEQHHPELGTARQRDPQGRLPAHILPPFDQSVPLQPLDRGQSNTGMEPRFAPLRPYSPSEAYLPGANAEPHVENLHREMVNHNFATFMHHPQAPMAPAGRYVLEPSIADALLQFRGQVRSMPDPYHEYAQTYRMVDGNRMEPVRPQPITGFMNEVRLPEGSFPPGTGLVIHSHPPRRDGQIVPGRPSEADMLRAYQDRTNALQDPRSNVTSHILYDHGTDSAFIYDGRLGPDGNPRYYQAVLPPSNQAPIPAPMQAHVSPELPLAAPVAQHPEQQPGILAQTPAREPSPVPSPAQSMAYLPMSPDLMNLPLANQNDIYGFMAALAGPQPVDGALHLHGPGLSGYRAPGTPPNEPMHGAAPTQPASRQSPLQPATPEFNMSQWVHDTPSPRPATPSHQNVPGWDASWNDLVDMNPKSPPAG